MPFPTPQLDDLTFQQIVDHAKRLITDYCPEWTDHNVSDPGVTLIELFASMTELLLYRVNQVPDKVYLTFLNFIGARLIPPDAAQAEVTLYLSQPLGPDVPDPQPVPAGTEVTTVRTETSEPVVFATSADLTFGRARLLGAFRVPREPDLPWERLDLERVSAERQAFDVFPPSLAAGDGLYLALAEDARLGRHCLEITAECVAAAGSGVRFNEPPVEWQAWHEDVGAWLRCEVELDATGGFNRSGRILVHLPQISRARKAGLAAPALWLRCVLNEHQQQPGERYEQMPRIFTIRALTCGATVAARQEVVVGDELLGQSDGTPGQIFRLRYAPVREREREAGEHLVVRYPDGEEVAWEERPHFGSSTGSDRHYTLDSHDGTIALGPMLRQLGADGKLVSFGEVPPLGSRLIFRRYRYGGGQLGNVEPHTITVLKLGRRDIRRVTNRRRASGGRDGQSLEDLRRAPPAVLDLRTRAVTADDYEHLGRLVPGVARARCIAPGRQSDPARPPDLLRVLIVPALPAGPLAKPFAEPVAFELLELTPEKSELLARVREQLEARAPLGVGMVVQAPRYVGVAVEARVELEPGASSQLRADVEERCRAALYRFLHPVAGGHDGAGWPFGQSLYYWELYDILRAVPGVARVRSLQMRATRRDGAPVAPRPDPVGELELDPDMLVCSDLHSVSGA